MAEGSTADRPESRVTRLVEARCDRDTAGPYLSLPLDQFEINGPNGTHYAFRIPSPRTTRIEASPGSEPR